MIIIGFVEYPLAQLIPSFLLFLSTTILIIKERPFKSKLFTTLVLANELTYLIVLGVYIVYHYISDGISPNARYNNVGFSLICLLMVSIIFNCLIGLIQIIYAVVGMCQKDKSKMKIQEENDELFAFRKISPEKPKLTKPAIAPQAIKIEAEAVAEDAKKGIKERR